jgi:hypothetical protein
LRGAESSFRESSLVVTANNLSVLPEKTIQTRPFSKQPD